jgi:hypothetical protein
LVEEPEGKRPLGRLGLDGRVLEKQGGKVWIGFMWLRIGTSGVFLLTR